jgi:spore coat protein A
VRTAKGADYYEMTQRAGTQEILPGLKTEVWGYDGIFPGPTIEARSGRIVEIRQWNELPVPVSTHLHGGKTPPQSDGYPTDLILPKGHERGPSGHGGSAGEHSHYFKDYHWQGSTYCATRSKMDFRCRGARKRCRW